MDERYGVDRYALGEESVRRREEAAAFGRVRRLVDAADVAMRRRQQCEAHPDDAGPGAGTGDVELRPERPARPPVGR